MLARFPWQAFLFVDGEAIRDDGSFLAIDVLTTLVTLPCIQPAVRLLTILLAFSSKECRVSELCSFLASECPGLKLSGLRYLSICWLSSAISLSFLTQLISIIFTFSSGQSFSFRESNRMFRDQCGLS
jgi:hypothetical protein